MENLNIKNICKGDRALIQYEDEKEIVTIGDMGKTFVDVIFENGDLRKVVLEEVLIEIL